MEESMAGMVLRITFSSRAQSASTGTRAISPMSRLPTSNGTAGVFVTVSRAKRLGTTGLSWSPALGIKFMFQVFHEHGLDVSVRALGVPAFSHHLCGWLQYTFHSVK